VRCSPRQLHCTGGLRLDQIGRLSTTLVVNTASAGDLEDQGKAEGRTSFLCEGVSAGARAGAGGGRRPWALFVQTWAAKEVAGWLE
ncbi:hypothetical protein, partial [Streptomyces albidoflavus]|uniref:hypothetical protein n=1 Tax=Streptomyces albidoflavus TaxID=1886 RepID=UPI0038D223EC